MRSEECLTGEQETAFREVYSQDVRFWGWAHWCHQVKKFGEGQMGLVWVILPYRPDPIMPATRRRMNELYWTALEEEAAEYGLKIRLDAATNKLILFAPAQDEDGSKLLLDLTGGETT